MMRKYLNIQVKCMREPERVESMEVILEETHGRYVPLESRGCEQASPCPECSACRAWVSDKVFHDPNLPTHIPLIPTLRLED